MTKPVPVDHPRAGGRRDGDARLLPRLLAEGRRFDLAFLDGNHRFEGVFLDLIYSGRVLKAGGIVFFDDTQLPGVRRAVDFCIRAWRCRSDVIRSRRQGTIDDCVQDRQHRELDRQRGAVDCRLRPERFAALEAHFARGWGGPVDRELLAARPGLRAARAMPCAPPVSVR
jgi:methyltransferase family protein